MSILKDVNYIKDMMVIPCAQPSWLVIIETGFAAAPPALLTLFLPGCTDIVKTKLGLSPWHHKGIKALIKGAVQPEMIKANKFLYNIGYFTAEKYLWWFMVADVTSNFVTTWQSMVFQAQQCELPGAGTAYGYFDAFVYQPDQEGYIPWTPIHGNPGVAFSGSTIGIMPGFEASIAFSILWDSWPVAGQGANVSTWLERVDPPLVDDLMATNDPALKNKNRTSGSIYHQNIGAIVPTLYRIGYANTGSGNAQIVGGNFNIGLTGRASGVVPWGCKPKPVSWPFPSMF